MAEVTFYNESRGYHQVLIDGIASKYEIFNGDAGLSGNGPNEYGIHNKETQKMTRIGSLHKAKKTVKNWINKE